VHLETGGVLALMLDDPWAELAEGSLPWRVSTRTALRRSDGAELLQHRTLEHLDRAEQVTTTVIRYRGLHDGRVVEEERHTIRTRLYFEDELRTMLETAGVRDIESYADSTAEDAAAAAWRPVVVARRSATP